MLTVHKRLDYPNFDTKSNSMAGMYDYSKVLIHNSEKRHSSWLRARLKRDHKLNYIDANEEDWSQVV